MSVAKRDRPSKELALKLLRQGLGTDVVAERTGAARTSVQHWQTEMREAEEAYRRQEP